MLKNPQDCRARRTAAQIKAVMLTLMEKKQIHEIRVSELCRACGINRATFYDHYRDVFDLVQDLERDVLVQLQDLMERVVPEQIPPAEVSRLFFAFLTENRDCLRVLLHSERSREFFQRLDRQIMPFFERKARQNYVIPAGSEYEMHCALRFVAMGYYGFFVQTLERDETLVGRDALLAAKLGDACMTGFFLRRQR